MHIAGSNPWVQKVVIAGPVAPPSVLCYLPASNQASDSNCMQ